MCGICGTYTPRGTPPPLDVVREMADALVHRGPDDAGCWADEESGIAFGHRRLAIVDLSSLGHQPMRSASGRYVITYNGEIYNHAALRQELSEAGFIFRGHSDTEVLLAAVERWGIGGALRRFIGIFAFALWDSRERLLHLGRDHLGVKPLYYGWAGDTLLFASELTPFRRFPGFDGRVSRHALALLLRHNCIPAPHTIYEGVAKLPPGTVLSLRPHTARDTQPREYWTARNAAIDDRSTLTDDVAIERLDELLRDAVGLQMMADVPLGAFLSGGVDSSTVVALMQAQSSRPVRTFSIGFHEQEFNEAAYAKRVAAHLGTDHTELYVTAADALAVIPRLASIYDEPFADSSQIPTFLVSQLARQHVTVSLSGDGGDELFAGYNRHVYGQRVWKRLRRVPLAARRALSNAITSVPPDTWDRRLRVTRMLRPRQLATAHTGFYLHKLADVLAVDSAEHMYLDLVSHWKKPEAVVLGSHEPPTFITQRNEWPALKSFTEQMMYLDLATYLPDDILTKIDRASMAVSLEARVPLLDPRVVEFAWRLPLGLKLRDGVGKWVLRQVLYRYVPRTLIERPKAGFGVPIGRWLRGPLREWAEALLDPTLLASDGFFDVGVVRRKWEDHLAGRRDSHFELWDVLMFQAWYHEPSR